MTTITVTAEDIAAGERDSCWGCPVAIAIWDAFPGIEHVSVDAAYATLGTGSNSAEVGLPDAATRFIEAFDLGEPVAPFSFELDYPVVAA